MSYGAYECREFVEMPILLEIALALNTSTTRVAAMRKKAVTSGAGDANHVSVFLWRPRESDRGWVLVKPPGATVPMNEHHLRELGLRSSTSMKFYSMGVTGPARNSRREAAYKTLAKDLGTTDDITIR